MQKAATGPKTRCMCGAHSCSRLFRAMLPWSLFDSRNTDVVLGIDERHRRGAAVIVQFTGAYVGDDTMPSREQWRPFRLKYSSVSRAVCLTRV